MENKHDKFIRLAEHRTNDVLNKLRLIGNLSNKKNYNYSSEEVNEIFNAIDSELKKTNNMFELEIEKNDSQFKFRKGKG